MNNKEQIALELTKIYWKDKTCSFKREVKDTYNYFFNEVEIIEDAPKEDTPISKLYVNNELQYDLTPKEDLINHLVTDCGCVIEDAPKEDKKIEKFKIIKDNEGGNVLLDYDNKKYIISVVDAITLDKINEILDYIKSKGE